MVERWGQKVEPEKGALHRALHIPQDEKIPVGERREILKMPVGESYHGIPVTAKLKEQINFSLNISGRGKKR